MGCTLSISDTDSKLLSYWQTRPSSALGSLVASHCLLFESQVRLNHRVGMEGGAAGGGARCIDNVRTDGTTLFYLETITCGWEL